MLLNPFWTQTTSQNVSLLLLDVRSAHLPRNWPAELLNSLVGFHFGTTCRAPCSLIVTTLTLIVLMWRIG